MTVYQCSVCGNAHLSSDPPCAQVFEVASNPRAAGETIRKILLALHTFGHTREEELEGIQNYGTDALRRAALDHAGLCWLTPGEMAPGCGCEWSRDNPTTPRELLDKRLEELESKRT